MNEKNLTKRQVQILKTIVEQYISNALPISSKEININFLKNLSSATIRNEMAVLERKKLIEKTHTSSGRIPTKWGYEFYQQNILTPYLSSDIKLQLKKIFAKRVVSIENVIDECTSLINESLKLPTIIMTKKNNEILKRIDLIPLHKNLAIILIVTSSGTIVKNTISFKNESIASDLSTCIRIFNDRLIDTKLTDLTAKIEILKPIIKNSVENYEFIMQEMIKKIFKYNMNDIKTSIQGTKYLITQPEFKNIEKLKKILNLLDNSTIWQQIAYLQTKTGKTTLFTNCESFGANDLMVASTFIKGIDNSHQISIIGPQRMDYAKVKAILEFIKYELEKKYNE